MKKKNGQGADATNRFLADEIRLILDRHELLMLEISRLEDELSDIREVLVALECYLDVCVSVWMRDVEVEEGPD